jgi:hypothetical protein
MVAHRNLEANSPVFRAGVSYFEQATHFPSVKGETLWAVPFNAFTIGKLRRVH